MKTETKIERVRTLFRLCLAAIGGLPCQAQWPLPDDFNPGAGGMVRALLVQPDGNIVVGGDFTTLAGQTRSRIGRLSADGTLDTGFNPGVGGDVYSLAVQADGKILVGGFFSNLGGQTRSRIGRLNPDGSLDPTFNPGVGGSIVESLAVQPDGTIVVVGGFGFLGGKGRMNIGRLNADGTLDAGFNPGADAPIYCVALQPDGKILLGGAFTSVGGQTRNNIARLNAAGSVDLSFDPGSTYAVNCLAIQADGKILVGGNFSMLDGQPRNKIARLNAAGTLDLSFNPGADASIDIIWSMALQADGKILVGGRFTKLGGQVRNHIARLNGDGTVDPTFNPGASGGSPSGYKVTSVVLQPDGRILVGGDFTMLGGESRNRIGRLNNTHPATQSLACDGSNITWLRGGTSPEVWRTTFEASTNGTDWIGPVAPRRISGGWQFTNVALPVNTIIRARGFVAAGYDNASGWFVEHTIITAPPSIVVQPVSQTNNVGTDTALSVVVEGTPPLSYQWRKDGAHMAGASTSTLLLTNLQESDQGSYSVVVSNAFGAVTSATAFLSVNQPPVADASATRSVVISANGADARVVLDGTRSSDPDGDLLQYLWFSTFNSQPSTVLASGPVAVVPLPIGLHPLLLVVADGMLPDTNAFTVEVLTSAQAVDRLVTAVEQDVSRAQPLIATLSAALASIDRSNPVSAINQLLAFQNKVRAQVAPLDAALAASLMQQAQEIIDTLSGGGTNPGGRPHGRFSSITPQPNGRLHLQLAADRGQACILEASTNLLNWEMIGVATDHGDGTFTFEDANAARFSEGYYRLRMP